MEVASLDREDVSRIASALKEANIDFDVSADSTSVYVRYGQTAPARMLLAEKGCRTAPRAGNELFDKSWFRRSHVFHATGDPRSRA